MRGLGVRRAMVLKGEEGEAADRVVMGWRGFARNTYRNCPPVFISNSNTHPVLWPRGVGGSSPKQILYNQVGTIVH